ncbi:MAG: Uncharacterised protein [Cryomorphaceae bacterium]|nr:MAG: Uncharacterised protein [Cryomorphaceae bacterium]
MKNYLYAALGLLLSLPAFSQVVRREAHLTASDGEGTLTLRDSVRVFATDPQNGDYTATVHCWVHRDYVNVADARVMADAALLNEKKDSLGRVSESYPVDSLWESSARRMSKYYEVVLSGRVSARELERRSFPTIALEHFFDGRRGAVRDALVEVLKQQGWERKDFGDYEAWAYLNKSTNPGLPDFQALLIFRGPIPYCLINKGAPFEYEKLKGSEQRTHGMYYFFQRPNDRFLQEIDDIVFDYLPL